MDGIKTHPLFNLPFTRRPKCLAHVADLALSILPQHSLVLAKPNTPNLAPLHLRPQPLNRAIALRLNESLDRTKSLIHLAQPGRLPRRPQSLLRAQHGPRQILRLRILGTQAELVRIRGNGVSLLRPLQMQEGLGEIEGALQGGGVLEAVDIDGGAGVMLDLGPFLEFDAGDGAVCEEGWVGGVLLYSKRESFSS